MNDLSINVVNTPGYGKELRYNTHLLSQLYLLADAGIQINILINGELMDYGPASPNIHYIYSKERVPLGRARYLLAKATTTKWYMQVDEDDELFPINEWLEDLLAIIPKINTPTAFFRFKCESSGEVYPDQFDNASLIQGRKTDVAPFYDFLTSCGVLYNKDILADMPRPNINFAEDDMTFFYLCRHHPETTYIPLKIFIYHDEDSVMSKDKEDVIEDDFYSKGFDHMSMFSRLKCVQVIW